MEIKILGTGCAKCRKLEKNVKKALKNNAIEADVIKITEMKDIMAFDILSTPGLVIEGKLKSSGKLLSPEEIATFIKQED